MVPTYRLVMRTGPTPGKAYPLEKGELLVGRDLAMDIVINDTEISRRHARIFMQGGRAVLEDLGSTNGTSVNGQRLMGPYVLQPGELITFGEHITLIFESVQIDTDSTIAAAHSQDIGQFNSPSQMPYQGAPSPYQGAPPAYQPAPTPYQSAPSAYQPAPSPYQAAQPPYQIPPLAPVNFAGQVPVSPLGAEPVPSIPTPKKKFPTWAIILIVALLFICCISALVMGGYLYNAPREFWCQFNLPGC